MQGAIPDREVLRSADLQGARALPREPQRSAGFPADAQCERGRDELALLQAALEATTDAILVTSQDRSIAAFNEQFLTMWGVSRAYVVQGDHDHLLAATSRSFADPRSFRERIDDIYTTSPPDTYDLLTLDDGRCIERTSRALTIDGQAVRRVWSFRDITDRRRSEESLHRQSELFRVTLAHIGDGVVTTDDKACVTSINSVAQALTGWSERDALGRPCTEVFTAVSEATRQPVENPATAALRLGAPVEQSSSAMLLCGRDGEERLIDASAAPIYDGQRRLLGAVLTFRDISVRRRNEDRLKLHERKLTDFFETAVVPLHWVDPEGRIVRVNQAELDLLGYEREEYLGRRIADFHVDRALIAKMLRKLKAGESLRDCEAKLRRKDGEIIDVVIDSSGFWQEGRFVHSRCFTRDVTRHKRIESALRDSEAQLRMITDHVPVLIARCDDQQRYRYVNRRYAERFERTPDEFIGRSIREVLGEDAFQTLRPHFEAVLAGERQSFDCQLTYRQLGPRYMRCMYEPDWGPDGAVIGWIALVSDITDQRQAEETRAMLGAIVQFSQDVIIGKSLDGRILTWNPAAEQLFGYSAEEAVGQSIALIVPPELWHEEQSILQRLARGQRIDHFETERVTRSGRRVNVSLAISPLRDGENRIIGASKIARDITDRKRAEAATRFLADASVALADVADRDAVLRRIANLAVPVFADWCAVDVREADGSIRRLALVHADPQRSELAAELDRRFQPLTEHVGPRRVLRVGQSEWIPHVTDDMLAAAVRNDEHLQLLRALKLRSYLCVPLKSRGQVLGTLTFVTSDSGREYDVQDLQLAEDLAHRAAVAVENAGLLAALREQDSRKDEFLATLAHELRNPLAPISNAVQVLRMLHCNEPDAAELCDVMERQANHLVRLVDDLMEVSRISRGKIDLRRQPVDVKSILSAALEIARPLINEAGHSLQVDLPAEPLIVDADQVRLAQVVTNLLTNATKYMHSGGSIDLVARREDNQAVISVRDTGLGIPPEMLPRIFEMFTQMDHTRAHAQGGLGIGLALARRLIELHGGRVEARSAGIGRGSEFIIRLPMSTQATAAGAIGNPQERATLPRRRILVVDDTRAALFVIDKLLTAMGQDVRTCSDAADALSLALEDPPDLMISDIGMPDMDGYELARRFREEPTLSGVHLVALTGYGAVSDRQRARAAGFDQHLVKPVGIDALQELLASLPVGRSSADNGR